MYQQIGTSVISANPHPTDTVLSRFEVEEGGTEWELTFLQHSYIYSLT